MKDLDKDSQFLEMTFGLISGGMMFFLHERSVAAGSKWEYDKPETMDIVVTKDNAESIYECCREVHSGYSVGYTKGALAKIKSARKQAHDFLYEEANNPNTSIERKIELVKITSKKGRSYGS